MLASSLQKKLLPNWKSGDCQISIDYRIEGSKKPITHPLYGTFHQPDSLYTTVIELPASSTSPQKKYKWSYRTGVYGDRLTSPDSPGNLNTRKEKHILILGDSFMHGDAVNDSGTAAWILQSMFPKYQFWNFARGGTANTHQAIQLRDAVQENILIPKKVATSLDGGVVIIGYADYYLTRNILAPSRLREVANWKSCQPVDDGKKAVETVPKSIAPRAILTGRSLTIEPISELGLSKDELEKEDPSLEYQRDVTIALIQDSAASINKLGAKPAIAFIAGKDDDRVIAHAKAKGIPVIDLRGEKNFYDHDSLSPYDSHPGYLANQTWASRIASFLKEHVKN